MTEINVLRNRKRDDPFKGAPLAAPKRGRPFQGPAAGARAEEAAAERDGNLGRALGIPVAFATTSAMRASSSVV